MTLNTVFTENTNTPVLHNRCYAVEQQIVTQLLGNCIKRVQIHFCAIVLVQCILGWALKKLVTLIPITLLNPQLK